MSFLSRLVGKRKPTALQDLVERITPQQPGVTLLETKNEDLRLAAGVSVLTLYIAGRFHPALTEIARSPVDFDLVTFEAAAYCHYQLLRDEFASDDDRTEDEYWTGALRDALHLTGELIRKHASLPVHEKLFGNRTISYSRHKARTGREEAEDLERYVLASLKAGTPCDARPDVRLDDLKLIVATKAAVAQFHNTWIPALRQSAHGLYDFDFANPP